jgi:hypothetical protein
MPANTSVFTGADGSLTLSAATGAEGERAQTVLTDFDLVSVGRVQSVRVEVSSEIRAFNEIGQRYATELRPGNVNITGTIGRAHVNGALLKLMLGEGGGGTRPAAGFPSPSFNLSLHVENSAFPGSSSTITVHGVKLDGWSYSMPEDDFVLEQVSFKALWIGAADAGS